MARRGVFLVFLALGVAGCGVVEDVVGSKTLSCAYSAAGWCSQVTGVFVGSAESQFSDHCATAQGTPSSHGCATADTVPGYCAFNGSLVDLPADLYQGRNYYGAALWTTGTAGAACTEFGGSWHN